jgi:hypothetical protein
MTVLFRIVASAIVVVGTFYLVYWLPFALIPVPWGVAAIISYACAMGTGWYVWTRTASVSTSLARSVAYWALVIGGIGFVGGFFGPLLLNPDANQGPLLGILITGPAGLLLGAIGGLVHCLVQRKRAGSDAST